MTNATATCYCCGKPDATLDAPYVDPLCDDCRAAAERHDARGYDEGYERAAAQARGNDFEDTDGRDWT